MSLLLKPDITVNDIKIGMDANSSEDVARDLAEIGRNIPIVSVGDYVLNIGDLKSLRLQVALNCLPSFTMTITDTNYQVREVLKRQIDKCVIFIGYKEWYIKFNGIITTIQSDPGDEDIELTGILFNDKLYQTEQKSYRDLSPSDVFLDICKKTKMGLFTFDNLLLNKKIDYCLNTEVRFIDYIDNIIQTYTDNIYAYDLFYHLHVGNIESIRKQKFDQYTVKPTGEKISPQDIIFTSHSRPREEDQIKDQYKLPIEFYTLNSNFTKTFLSNASEYKVGIPGIDSGKIIPSDVNIGYGNIGTNTFSGFKEHKNPFYSNIINKSLGGNVISISLKQLMFEISPFSVVGFEAYLPETGDKKYRLDEEHSGKKVVIGFRIEYEKSMTNGKNYIHQTIDLI